MHGTDDHELAHAITGLTHVLRDLSGHCATQRAIHQLEENLTMKISDVKTALQTASRQQKEALAEIGTQIADLNVQIQELRDAATDPNVTDEEFNTLVATLQTDAQALANIVPGSPTTDGSGVTT